MAEWAHMKKNFKKKINGALLVQICKSQVFVEVSSIMAVYGAFWPELGNFEHLEKERKYFEKNSTSSWTFSKPTGTPSMVEKTNVVVCLSLSDPNCRSLWSLLKRVYVEKKIGHQLPFVAKSWPLYVSGQLFSEKKVGHNGYNPCIRLFSDVALPPFPLK